LAAFPQYAPHLAIAVIARPDADRGEKLIAVTNEAKLTLAELRHAIQRSGLGNLAVPKALHFLAEIPLLATGKVNLRELERLVTQTA